MPPNGADGGLPPGRGLPGGDGPGDPDWTAIDGPAAPQAVTGPAAPQAVTGPAAPQAVTGPAAPPVVTRPAAGASSTPDGPLLIGPMNFVDILDGAFTLYRANARTLIAVTATLLLPVKLLVAWLGRDVAISGASGLLSDSSANRLTFNQGSSVARALVALGVSVLLVPFLHGVVSRVGCASYFGGRLGPAEALRAVRGRWWALIAAWVLVHLAEGVGGVLLFFPALLVMALFMAVAPAIAIEGLGPIQGMRRSARLLGPRMLPVLGVALGSAVVVSGVDFALGWLPALLGVATGPWGWLFQAAGTVLTSVLATPYVALVATLVYFDARIRSEGMDVALLAGRLARRDSGG